MIQQFPFWEFTPKNQTTNSKYTCTPMFTEALSTIAKT